MGLPQDLPDPVLDHGQAALARLSAVCLELRARGQDERADRLTRAHTEVARVLSAYAGEVSR